MFTGLVEERAEVVLIHVLPTGSRIQLRAMRILEDVHLGDSISVNGVCLTVTEYTAATFSVDAVPETMRRTNLHTLQTGDWVHVERALPANGRLGGHFVTGHVDGTGVLRKKGRDGLAVVLTIEPEPSLHKYIVNKGAICLDGVSLTVMDVTEREFSISIIPHTGQHTNLTDANIGSVFNLECDILAKYMERLLREQGPAKPEKPPMTREFLQQHGYL